MPLYTYCCTSCGHQDDEYMRMADAVASMPCPQCGGLSYFKMVSQTHSLNKDFHTPVEMNSVATIDPKEIQRLQRQCPDAEIADDPNHPLYGVPIARNRAAKKQVLKAQGFQERNGY